jgi:hypothetical protein
MSTKGAKHVFLVFATAVCAGACASTAAKTKPADLPGLNVPAPPPRIVEPTPTPAQETVPETVPDTPVSPGVTGSAASRSNTRPASPKSPAAEGKPEAKPGSETKPNEPPPTVEPAPSPQLRPSDSTGAAKSARDAIDRARRILSTIDYRPLSKERRKAYDDARRFADQADDALKQGNVVFAQAVAAKAETLAKELASR